MFISACARGATVNGIGTRPGLKAFLMENPDIHNVIPDGAHDVP